MPRIVARLEPARVARDVARRGAVREGPARARLADRAGVEAAVVDHHVGVAGGRVDRDVTAGARQALAHEAARVPRGAEQAGEVERKGDGARAVVAAVVVGAVPTAVLVGLARDPVARRDDAPDDAVAGAVAATGAVALEHMAGRQAEGAAGLGADDPVGGQAVAGLEALDRGLGLGAEDAVGGEAEGALEGANAAASMVRMLPALGRVGATVAVAALEHGAGTEAERRPRGRTHDAVGREPVLALVALDILLGLRAEDAVGGDAEGLLERAHLVLRLSRVRVRPGARLGGGGRQGSRPGSRPGEG